MNESSPNPLRRSGKLFFVMTSIGVALALAVAIEGLFLLRAWKRAARIETKDVAKSNIVSVVNDKPVEGAIRSEAWEDLALSPPQKRPRVPNDNFVDRFPLETPGHATASTAGASNEPGEHMQNTRIGLV